MTTIFNNNLINENYSVEKMNKQYPCRNTENDFTVKTDSEASSLTNQSVDLGKLFNFQSQLQLQNDDHQQQQQYQELISLMSYRNNIAQLANSYEQIIKTFRKVELEAKAYKVSAACQPPKSVEKLNSTDSCTQIINRTPSNCQNNRESSIASSVNQPIIYQLNMSKYLELHHFPWQSSSSSSSCYPGNMNCSTPIPVNRLSCKVFIGGIPMLENNVTTLTRDQLYKALFIFGQVDMIWPKRTLVIPYSEKYHEKSMKNCWKRGHCYAVFNDPRSVTQLLSACYRRPKGYYINLSRVSSGLKNARLDSLQIIPWDTQGSVYESPRNNFDNPDDENTGNSISLQYGYKMPGSGYPAKIQTVFVGALHGIMTARVLFTIFNDLFGNVVRAVIDTDKYNYPIGSGRVVFLSPQSYLAAVTTNFIRVECQLFSKVIQIDPYLENALCSKCFTAPGIYFCRHLKCFEYFCPNCWISCHDSLDLTHKPLKRVLSPNSKNSFP
uniref:RRM domain-containing protein n=1 Tax=Trichobilharzia regenti TaxID=157069 RepID=A0AA85IYV6_TRIRE|nr:unnamed protein product [Trichobilharzia regenti]